MLKVSLIVVLLFLGQLSGLVEENDGPIVETSTGWIEGESLPCGLFCSFNAFKGIPYAAPPIGNLRFSAPVLHPEWTGVRLATEHGHSCPGAGLLGGLGDEDEDCLFLNVYSRNLRGRRPVMVWIHGGGFTSGSGDSFIYGPEFFMVDDVVMISINYRLGFLGFFSTGDAAASGNWGLKDIIAALKWVRDNVAQFGGDPDNVTIFGESAGGVAVHYLVLSELAKGLFHKAVSESGTAINPWAFQTEPGRVAADLARRMRILYTSSEDLVEQMRTRPFQDFLDNRAGFWEIERPRTLYTFDIAPCVESGTDGVIDRPPLELMQMKSWNDVPYLIGYNSDESMFMQREHLIDFGVHRFFNTNPWTWTPILWKIPRSHPDNVAIMRTFQDLYFEGQEPSRDWDMEWTWYLSDHAFIYGIDKTVRMHASSQNSPVYHYRFSFDGSLNLVKRLLLLQFPGAVHGDELPYMFNLTIPDPLFTSNEAILVRRRLVRLWSNFAKYSNPTPVADQLLQNIVWPRVTNGQEYLDIGEDLVVSTQATGARMSVWHELEERYARF